MKAETNGAPPIASSSRKLNQVFLLWEKMSSHLRMRDRSVKILQYGCQMLSGYYGARMTKAMRDAIAGTRTTASNARKTYWMLKPIFHVNDVLKMMKYDLNTLSQMSALEFLDVFEAFMWIMYYIFENLILLVSTFPSAKIRFKNNICQARLKIKYFNEQNFEFPCNLFWFIGDVTFFASTSYRFCSLLSEYIQTIRYSEKCENSIENFDEERVKVVRLDLVDRTLALVIVRFTTLGWCLTPDFVS